MNTSPHVERWFGEKKPPTEATIRKVREIILRADRRMTEFVKYGTLTFAYDGDFATVVQVSDKKQASVMLNRGRFADPAEAQVRAAKLSKIVAAWCSLTPAGPGSAKKA